MKTPIVRTFGERWEYDADLTKMPGSSQGGQGVYILCSGMSPVYVGKGNIRQRIRAAKRSKRRGAFWTHFSWFVPSDPERMGEMEALLIRALLLSPKYPRVLNRQGAKIKGKVKLKLQRV